MRIGVPKETAAGEHRVALVPEVVAKLKAKGLDVVVQSGAGDDALLTDDAFRAAGADVGDASAVWSSDIVVTIAPPDAQEIASLGKGSILIGFLAPLTSPDTTRALAAAGATAFAMEAIPRISRAQAMDALSSQSNVAGYRAALLGADEMGRFYPMLMTAAGTIPPAKVLVLGVGVAGLQALATAKRLGARTTGSLTLTLEVGVRYAILAACDESCSDVDLRVADPSGAVLAEDTGLNDTPVVEFTAPAAGAYKVDVVMFACQAERCAWGARVFRR